MGVHGIVWDLVGNLMEIRGCVVKFSETLGFPIKFIGDSGPCVEFSGQINGDWA